MILEDLWSGRFYPAETVVPTAPEYREVNREISEKMERLQAQFRRRWNACKPNCPGSNLSR